MENKKQEHAILHSKQVLDLGSRKSLDGSIKFHGKRIVIKENQIRNNPSHPNLLEKASV
jgi:hypothetical protein